MSENKKILIFIDWFLPGYKAGGPIRSVANLTDALHEFYDFYIITSDRDYLETAPYKNVKFDTWTNFDSKAKVYYTSEKNKNKGHFNHLISELNPEIVYINGIYSYYYSILPLRISKKLRKKTVIAPRGMLSNQAFSTKKLKKKFFITATKLFRLYKDLLFHATNDKEASDIKKEISKSARVIVAPNLTRQKKFEKKISQKKHKGTLKMASIARISREKNTLFSLEILKLFDYSGNIEFDLYGSIYDKEYWKLCLDIIKTMPQNVSINYKSELNSNLVRDTYSNYHFAFLPSKGENFGHSIFEALSAACPVIISDQTPWKKLEEKRIGWDLPLADKEGFREVIQTCINMNQKEYDEISKNAYKFALNYSKNNDHIKQTKKLFD